MLLPLGLVRVRWSARRLDRSLWAVWFALALLVLILTSSRGAWLGAGAALGLLALHDAGFLRPSRRARWGVVGAALLVVALAGLVFSLDMFDTPRRGTSERQELYRIALDTFADHPLTGTGPFTFGRAALENRSCATRPAARPRA